MEPAPKRRRRWIVHALGMGAGAVLAVATIAGASEDSEAPPTEPPRSEPAWRKAKPAQAAIYSGAASDGSVVVLTLTPRRWRWEASSIDERKCHPKPNSMGAVDTYALGYPQPDGRFHTDEGNWRTSDVDGAPAQVLTHVWLDARRLPGDRIQGAFRRSDRFHTRAIHRFTCVRKGSFELTRAPALP